jgi:hypothetical protein
MASGDSSLGNPANFLLLSNRKAYPLPQNTQTLAENSRSSLIKLIAGFRVFGRCIWNGIRALHDRGSEWTVAATLMRDWGVFFRDLPIRALHLPSRGSRR